MNKKTIIILIIILILISFILLKTVYLDDKLSNFERYNLLLDETITSKFKIKNKKYLLTTYHNSESTYAYNNLLLQNKGNYYLLEKIDKCDISYFINDNNLYIHCIGKKGDILKYTINLSSIKKDVLEFNYKNTPNISQIHITIDKVDDEYIYLKSAVKKDDLIKDGEYVKCSLLNRICEYDK